jgi:hypothetical protein
VKRSTLHVVLSFVVAGLLMLATGLAAAQMLGQEKAQQPSAAQPAGASMQSMMAQMRGMMAEMQGMMHAHQGMMAGQGMPGMMGGQRGMMSGKGMPGMMGANSGMSAGQEKSGASAPSSGNWPGMMRSMDALGASMQQMMTQMDNVISNNSLMENPTVKSNVGAMQKEMRRMTGSLYGMIRNMDQIQKSQPATRK